MALSLRAWRASPLAPCRPSLVAAAFFSAAINLLALTVPLYSMQVFDRVMTTGSLETLFFLSAIALAALVFIAWLEILRSRLLLRVATWIERTLGPECLRRGLAAPPRSPAQETVPLRELGVVRQMVGGPTLNAVMDLPWAPIYLGALWLLHPYLGLVALVGAALLTGLTMASEVLTRRRYAASLEAAAAAQRLAEAALRSRDAVEGLGMSSALVARWQGINGEGLDHAGRAGEHLSVTLALTRWARMSVQVLTIAAGAALAVAQVITPGALLASSILMARALAPVEQVIGAWRQLVMARAAWRRVAAHLADPPPRRSMRDLPVRHGRLVAEGVSVAAPHTGRTVLRDVSLAAGPAEVVVVIGPSGSGKSALARVLIGAQPIRSGSVRLDGADVFAWDPEDLSLHLGYLPQEVELFDGTIREAIGRLGEAPMDEVVEAARLAGIHELILRLPEGYETRIGAGGVPLSHGQRQRLGFARAVFGDPRVVVMDEPNAHLDGHGEMALMAAVARLKERGATVVATTHRPTLLRMADRVVVLRDGAVERAGPRDEVMAALARPRQPAPAVPMPAPAEPMPTPAEPMTVAADARREELPLPEARP